MNGARPDTPRRSSSFGRWVLAILLLAMAAGQISDATAFVDVLETYDIGGRAVAWGLAIVLVTAEVIGGGGLLGGRPRGRRVGSAAALLVAVVWTILGAQAFARGLVLDNCGCFGVHLAQPLRWWILLEDAELVALAWWVRTRGAAPVGRPLDRPGVEADDQAGVVGESPASPPVRL